MPLSFKEFVDQFVDSSEHVSPPVEIPELPPVEEPMTAIEPVAPIEQTAPVEACTPRNLISALFSARDKAHQLHLRTRSFSAHIALGELYEGLLDLADQLAEVVQGKYGIMEPIVSTSSVGDDPIAFIHELASWVETAHSYVPTGDSFINNLIDEVQALVYRTKYKLDNLH